LRGVKALPPRQRVHLSVLGVIRMSKRQCRSDFLDDLLFKQPVIAGQAKEAPSYSSSFHPTDPTLLPQSQDMSSSIESNRAADSFDAHR
jgi:hypothetical protein